MKTAKDWVSFIEQRKSRGHGVAYFKRYMDSLAIDYLKLKCVHVAGTNGKGSLTNYLRAIVQEAGYRVATFTSPYLIHHYDRIRINDIDISQAAFLDIANRYGQSWIEWDLGMFEIDMMIACVYFLESNVDLCIFETGLGGRLDMTNIIKPIVSVITNIGMDHMQILGSTYEQIAYEKAGIIKENTPLVTIEQKQECLVVFETIAKQKNAPMISMKPVEVIKKQPLIFKHRQQLYSLASKARYQCENAALALEVSYLLAKQYDILEIHRQKGLQTIWKGRFEVLREQPLFIIDGAHNVAGIKALLSSLEDNQEVTFLFSALKDKNFEEMLTLLQQRSSDVRVTLFQNDRAFKKEDIIPYATKIYDDYQYALDELWKMNHRVVVTGSLYFISEVRSYLLHKKEAIQLK